MAGDSRVHMDQDMEIGVTPREVSSPTITLNEYLLQPWYRPPKLENLEYTIKMRNVFYCIYLMFFIFLNH